MAIIMILIFAMLIDLRSSSCLGHQDWFDQAITMIYKGQAIDKTTDIYTYI